MGLFEVQSVWSYLVRSPLSPGPRAQASLLLLTLPCCVCLGTVCWGSSLLCLGGVSTVNVCKECALAACSGSVDAKEGTNKAVCKCGAGVCQGEGLSASMSVP